MYIEPSDRALSEPLTGEIDRRKSMCWAGIGIFQVGGTIVVAGSRLF
jgi:hypothetical protein